MALTEVGHHHHLISIIITIAMHLLVLSWWGTGDAEIKVSAESQELSQVLPLKPEAGENIAIHASPIARNFSLSNFYLSGPFIFIFPKSSS